MSPIPSSPDFIRFSRPTVAAVMALFAVIFAASLTTAAVWRVEPDGSGQFPTIQQAIASVADGDTIELGTGVFSGVGNRDLDFMARPVVLRSATGDPGTCVIDAQGSGSAHHRAIWFRSGEGPETVVEGIAFRNGFMDQVSYPYGHGGGVVCDQSSPTIRNCIFAKNYAQRGGGLYLWHSSSRIEGCRFVGNTASLGGGAIGSKHGPIVLESCVITGNEAAGGGGILSDVGSNLFVHGCTVGGNHASYWGGGLAAGGSVTTVSESILSGNCAEWQGDDVWCGFDSTYVDFECSAIDPGNVWQGPGEVTYIGEQVWDDPIFCEPLECDALPSVQGDYRLRSDSPCLPDVSPCGALVGALGIGCDAPVSVEDRQDDPPVALAAVQTAGRTIFYSVLLDHPTRVCVRLFDVTGRQRALVLDRDLPAGRHDFSRRLGVSECSGGVLFLVLDAAGTRAVRRVVTAG